MTRTFASLLTLGILIISSSVALTDCSNPEAPATANSSYVSNPIGQMGGFFRTIPSKRDSVSHFIYSVNSVLHTGEPPQQQ